MHSYDHYCYYVCYYDHSYGSWKHRRCTEHWPQEVCLLLVEWEWEAQVEEPFLEVLQ